MTTLEEVFMALGEKADLTPARPGRWPWNSWANYGFGMLMVKKKLPSGYD